MLSCYRWCCHRFVFVWFALPLLCVQCLWHNKCLKTGSVRLVFPPPNYITMPVAVIFAGYDDDGDGPKTPKRIHNKFALTTDTHSLTHPLIGFQSFIIIKIIEMKIETWHLTYVFVTLSAVVACWPVGCVWGFLFFPKIKNWIPKLWIH